MINVTVSWPEYEGDFAEEIRRKIDDALHKSFFRTKVTKENASELQEHMTVVITDILDAAFFSALKVEVTVDEQA